MGIIEYHSGPFECDAVLGERGCNAWLGMLFQNVYSLAKFLVGGAKQRTGIFRFLADVRSQLRADLFELVMERLVAFSE